MDTAQRGFSNFSQLPGSLVGMRTVSMANSDIMLSSNPRDRRVCQSQPHVHDATQVGNNEVAGDPIREVGARILEQAV